MLACETSEIGHLVIQERGRAREVVVTGLYYNFAMLESLGLGEGHWDQICHSSGVTAGRAQRATWGIGRLLCSRQRSFFPTVPSLCLPPLKPDSNP